MNKKYVICLSVVLIVALTSCSSVQNRERIASKPSSKNTIELKIASRSTTINETTTDTLDKKIENKIKNTLETLLSKGSKSDVKSEVTTEIYASTFQDYGKYKKNSADIEINLLKTDAGQDNLIATKVLQKLTDSTGKVSENSGFIYFNENASVIGFDFGPKKEL
ncbi:MAG: hypothetical protein U0R17_04285 [Acidimicrobiia bacterium]